MNNYMNDIKTGAALWQLSQLLSESENELWLAEHIHLFFLPIRCGSSFILSVVLSENAVFGIDLRTLEGGSIIPIRSEYNGVPLYSLFRKPVDSIVFTDSVLHNLTSRSYMTEYNVNNILQFLRTFVKRSPKNAHEGMLRDVLLKKTYDGMSFFEYINDKN
jgi:hypothetical protein